jgi:hypothetical protein
MTHLFSTSISLLFVGISLCNFSGAQAAELDGVTLPDKIQVGGKPLLLNGMGTRKATLFKVKVYVAGLYVQTLSHNAAEILDSNQLRRIDLHFVHDVSAEKLANAWKESLEKNCPGHCETYQPVLAQLNALMKDVQKGDVMTVTFFPQAIEVSLKNQPPTRIQSVGYPKLLLQSWLGEFPPNSDLKEGLLGLSSK